MSRWQAHPVTCRAARAMLPARRRPRGRGCGRCAGGFQPGPGAAPGAALLGARGGSGGALARALRFARPRGGTPRRRSQTSRAASPPIRGAVPACHAFAAPLGPGGNLLALGTLHQRRHASSQTPCLQAPRSTCLLNAWDPQDLVGEGLTALERAAAAFRPGGEARFSTYAAACIWRVSRAGSCSWAGLRRRTRQRVYVPKTLRAGCQLRGIAACPLRARPTTLLPARPPSTPRPAAGNATRGAQPCACRAAPCAPVLR